MKFNQNLIKRFKDGEIAIKKGKNNTANELKLILSEIYSRRINVVVNTKYYWTYENLGGWSCGYYTSLPIIRMEEFFKVDTIPQKWFIEATNDTLMEISTWFDNNYASNCSNFYKKGEVLSRCYTNNFKKGSGKVYIEKDTAIEMGISQITIEQLRQIKKREMTKEERLNKLQEEIKLLESEIKEDKTFEVGDIVKVTKKSSDDSRIFNGILCEIKKVASNHLLIVGGGGGLHFNEVEKVSDKEKEEYLLNKANRLYPIGTTYINVTDGCRGQIETIHNTLKCYGFKSIGGIQITDGCGGAVYLNGKWAEIKLNLPKIGCQEGLITKNDIRYGEAVLSKSALLEMEKAGITAIQVEEGDDFFNIKCKDLKNIYKICKS